MVKVRFRQQGATAMIARRGAATVRSDTGGEMALAGGVAEAGFSPLDLLFASVAGCLVVSARIAAGEMGILDRLGEARATVRGRKAADLPGRVERLDVEFEVSGDFDDATRKAIIARAEELCTVSNTLKRPPEFAVAGE
jgi:uncharacterized OsmC-like protein